MLLLAAGAVAAAPGCGGTKCNTSCLSPGSYLYTPTGLPAGLVDVTADSPCVAKLWPADGGLAQVQVTDDTATSGAVCVLHGDLADGRVVTATVTFGQASSDSCCPTYAASGGQFGLSDVGGE